MFEIYLLLHIHNEERYFKLNKHHKMSNSENKKNQRRKLNNMNLRPKVDQRIWNSNDLVPLDEKILMINNLISTCLTKREQSKVKSNIEAMGISIQQVFKETSMLKLILTSKKT